MRKKTCYFFLCLLILSLTAFNQSASASGQERGGGDVPQKPGIGEQFVIDVFQNQNNIKSLSLIFNYIETKNPDFFRPLFDDKSSGGRGSVFEFLQNIDIASGRGVRLSEDCTDMHGHDRGMMALIDSSDPLKGTIHICPAKLAQRHRFDFRERPSLERANLLALFIHELVHIFMGTDEQTADRLLNDFPMAKRLLEYKMLENKGLTEYQNIFEYHLILKNNLPRNLSSQNLANICNSLPALELPGDFMPVLERAREFNETTQLVENLNSAAEIACKSKNPGSSAVSQMIDVSRRLLSRLNSRLNYLQSQMQVLSAVNYPIPSSSPLRQEPELSLDQAPFVEDWQICARRAVSPQVQVLPHRICATDLVATTGDGHSQLPWGWNERAGAIQILAVDSTVRSSSTSAYESTSHISLRIGNQSASADSYTKKVLCHTIPSNRQGAVLRVVNVCTDTILNYSTFLYGQNAVKVKDVFENGLVTVQYWNTQKNSYEDGALYTIRATALSAQ